MPTDMKRSFAGLMAHHRRLACGALLIVLATIAAPPPSARADGDPASDILLAQDAFYPYQPPVTYTQEAAMNTVLHAAANAGLPLKVAILNSREDLGAVPNLFAHPQQYAKFLDQEISYNHRQPLLVVMPAGFGVVGAGSPTTLAGLKVDTQHGSYGLVHSAILAVVALVRATGRTIATPSLASSPSAAGSPPIILLFAIPAALIVLAGILTRRPRKPRGDPQSDNSSETQDKLME
jgi:hypothetical protein